MKSTILFSLALLLAVSGVAQPSQFDDPGMLFTHPPAAAKPGVLWMWMGSNLSKQGITSDLEALKRAGFNRTTMFSLADITTPWAGEIKKSPTPELISWTEPWWDMLRHAALESKRLRMDFGTFNGPSYESSGGKWITPELAMQELCWSKVLVDGGKAVDLALARPTVDPRANEYFPVYNPETGLVEKPVIPERSTYYRDIAVIAVPAERMPAADRIIDLTATMQGNGHLHWQAPEGKWMVYRFGHTLMGGLIQPAQWQAAGFECDKMSQVAVDFHIDHVIGEIKKHVGDLIGTGFTHVHFDSYEAGNPTWTPLMREAFLQRRGYDLVKWLPVMAGDAIGSAVDSARFRNDFDATIKDLYRDVYFTTLRRKLNKARLRFLCEPYGGPWRQHEIMPLVQDVMTEFWTHGGKYAPYELDSTVAALRKSGQNIIEAEAFTGAPADSKWSETPAWLKPIGDAAFCAGVNRLVLHRFVQQPWDDKYKPGATMGQWGTHFDRTQTWWNAMPSLVQYWQRCQALLQWGFIAPAMKDDFSAEPDSDSVDLHAIHRQYQGNHIWFVANTSHRSGYAAITLGISGMQAELWDPVTGEMRVLEEAQYNHGKTNARIFFNDAQSFFLVFRKPLQPASQLSVKSKATLHTQAITGPWKLQFDPKWGGPVKPVLLSALCDWTKQSDKGIKYYSGTGVYSNRFDKPAGAKEMRLDLGEVHNLAEIVVNDVNLGFVWCAPWSIRIPAKILTAKNNRIEIRVTNTWANRLIGDEQEPEDCEWLPGHMESGRFLKAFPDWFLKGQPRPSKGRYCFTTWNYFTKESPLLPAGLMGPVSISYR